MQKEQFIIWFAGFYEGEGSISNDKSNNNRLRVSVSQNDVTPLLLAKEIWGGSIRKRIRITQSGKICHGNEWRISHKASINFIDDIKPYLLIPYKINKIDKAFKIFEEGNNERYKCHFCLLDFASPASIRRHEKNQHINKNKKFNCKVCEKTYCSRDTLTRHIKLNHNSVTSVCENECDMP